MNTATSTMRQHIHLAPRRMQWDFSRISACPVDNDPDLAAFLLAISYFVVVFEDYGIPTVRRLLPLVENNPVLHREAQAFITQEALHSQGHVMFNTTLEERHGYDASAIKREFRRFQRVSANASLQLHLATVAAFEHVIFSVADWFENAHDIWPSLDPEFFRLLMWHAMEETEHTAVCYDIYEQVYGTGAQAYSVRIAGLARALRLGTRTFMRIFKALLPQVEERLGATASASHRWGALTRVGSPYLPDVLGYFKPRFHPWNAVHGIDGLLARLRRHLVPQGRDDAGWLRVRVEAIQDISSEARSYVLVPCGGHTLPAWTAGAHIEVELEAGIVRHYSLCDDPAVRNRYRIGVKCETLGRGGSLRLHQRLNLGDELRISAPRNHFALDHTAPVRETLLLAGGIGITPLIAMAYALHRRGEHFRLHAFARAAAVQPFDIELRLAPFAGRVQFHHGAVPTPFDFILPRWEPQRPRALYICGPKGFMEAACQRARELGWPEQALHLERFSHDGSGPRADDHAFTVELAHSGRLVQVPAHLSILEALEAAGLQPANSCREGVCGSCVCTVLSGAIDHRDAVLSAEESANGSKMAICVSRARDDYLSLDL